MTWPCRAHEGWHNKDCLVCTGEEKHEQEIAALKAQVKELLEIQHCDSVTMQKFQQTYEFHRAESIKLRAALKEIIFIGTKGTAKLFPEEALAKCVEIAKRQSKEM